MDAINLILAILTAKISAVVASIEDFLDPTLKMATKAAPAKTVGDALDAVDDQIAEVKADLSDEISARETADEAIYTELAKKANTDGVIASSEQLLSDEYTLDQVPYIFRPSGGNGADREEDMLVGGSIVWNQLLDNMRRNSTEKGLTFANNNGALTISGTITEAFSYNYVTFTNNNVPFKKDGSKYFLLLNKEIPFAWGISGYGLLIPAGNRAGMWTNNSGGVWTNGLNFKAEVGQTVDIRELKASVFNLTAMFGTEVADAVYAMEQAEAGAGVAYFRKLFPEEYYEYSEPTLKHMEGLSAHVMRDADNNIIANYPLDSSLILRGIPKVDVSGNLYYDGDTYESDGTVTRRYGVVDLGTLSWNYVSSNTMFVSSSIIPMSVASTKKAICQRYTQVNAWVTADVWGSNDNIFTLNASDNRIRIKNTAYTDATAFKEAMSGVMFVYELATTTTESAQPFQNPQIVDASGTEEYVTTSVVPVGHYTKYLDNLKAKIEQLPWNFATLIAPTEVAYTATRNYTAGALFIVDNILYKATANIANGGPITPNTNCTATTLAEVISALS